MFGSLAVAFCVASVLMGVLYRPGWVSGVKRVSGVQCSARVRRYRRSTRTVQECDVEFEDGLAIRRRYDRARSVPEVGDEVSVYFDPSDAAGTATFSGPAVKISAVVAFALASAVSGAGCANALRQYASA